MKLIKHLILSFLLATSITAHAASPSFACPAPSSIISMSEWGAPPWWFAPEVSGSFGGGVGIGGTQAGAFISSSPVTVAGKSGWICYYNSTSHMSIADIRKQNSQQIPYKLKNILETIPDQQDTGYGFLFYQAQS